MKSSEGRPKQARSLGIRGVVRFEEFELDPYKRRLTRAGDEIPIPAKAFEVLSYLVQRAGQPVTKEELLEGVWPGSFIEEGNLTQQVYTLRKALGEHSGAIVTLPGRGYQFAARVHPVVGNIAEESASSAEPAPVRLAVEESGQPGPAVTPPATGRSRIAWSKWAASGAAVLALCAAAWFGWRQWYRSARNPPTMILADFENDTGDPQFDHTLNRALEIDLAQSPFVNLLSRATIGETLSEMRRKSDAALEPAVAREICLRNQGDATLYGSIGKIGGQYLLTVTAEGCAGGKTLAIYKSEIRSKNDILRTIDAAAGAIREQLGESSASHEQYQVPLARATTPSLEALRDFSLGLAAFDNGDLAGAESFLKQALAQDPDFAAAYRALATVYYNQGNWAAARVNYKQAYALRDRTTERERLAIEIVYFANGASDAEEAIRRIQQYLAIYPKSVQPWITLGNTATQIGNYPQAIDAGEHAVRLDPRSAVAAEVLARAYERANRFADAKRIARGPISQGKQIWGLHSILFQIACVEQDMATLRTERQWGETHPPLDLSMDNFGYAEAMHGRRRKALEYFDRGRVEALRDGDSDTAQTMFQEAANVHVLFGEPQAAAASLKQITGDNYSDQGTMAVMYAMAGESETAKRILARAVRDSPNDTLLNRVSVPLVAAQVALNENKPLDAIRSLEAARPYQLKNYGILAMRGQAEVEADQLDRAATDFRMILANPGVDPMDPELEIAHLELGRILARQHKLDEARREYLAFLSLWPDADSDLPILSAARRELEALK
jgi:eukaryotic-like serine/threonine-protein kinase